MNSNSFGVNQKIFMQFDLKLDLMINQFVMNVENVYEQQKSAEIKMTPKIL